MPILLFLLLLLLLLALFFWISFNVVGLLIMLLVAGFVGWLADVIVPGRLPWGWLGAILAGLAGSWLGIALIGDRGPSLAGIPPLPALLGAIILAIVAQLIIHATARNRAV